MQWQLGIFVTISAFAEQQKCPQEKFEDLRTLISSNGKTFLPIRKVLGSDLNINQPTSTEVSWFSSTRPRCVRLTTLPTSCAIVMKSGNLNFLESSGPLQACNWTAYTSTRPLELSLMTSNYITPDSVHLFPDSLFTKTPPLNAAQSQLLTVS